MTVIETPRLLLRQIVPDDADFLLELLNEPAFRQFVGDRGLRTPDDARRYAAEGPMASYARHGFGLFLTVLKDGGVPIGICGLLKRDELEHVDLGYANLARHCGQGYAVEAADATMAWARDVLGLQRIVAIVNAENAASISLLRKVGMRFERMVQLRPGSHELCLYAWGSTSGTAP